jgi:hypothetical protein
VLGAIGVKALLKQKDKKEMSLYLILMLTSLLYSYATIFKWELPNPNELVTAIFDPLAYYFFGIHH